MKFWIKERVTPQAHYFVPCGQLSKADAKKRESPLYGDNTMIGYDNEQEYKAALQNLRDEGMSVHDV
jgi:hypothetical protein